jgi:hypothetical protein
MTQIPIRGQKGADPPPPLKVIPKGEALRALKPYSAVGGDGAHASREVLADVGKLPPAIAAEVRKVANTK